MLLNSIKNWRTHPPGCWEGCPLSLQPAPRDAFAGSVVMPKVILPSSGFPIPMTGLHRYKGLGSSPNLGQFWGYPSFRVFHDTNSGPVMSVTPLSISLCPVLFPSFPTTCVGPESTSRQTSCRQIHILESAYQRTQPATPFSNQFLS